MRSALRLGSFFGLVTVAVAVACSATDAKDDETATGAGAAGAASGSAGSGNGGSPPGAGGSIFDDGGMTGPCGEKPPTRITGTVFAPNATDPIYHALVYVPGSPVEPFKDGVECVQCGKVSGDPIAFGMTDTKGQFAFEAPCGKDVPLVFQVGKWRRQITLPEVACCQDNVFDDPDQMRLPKNQTEGDLPRMALVTGQVDNLECAFRKIGIDDSEFTLPTSMGGDGHIQWYMGDGAPGAILTGAPSEDQLWGTAASLAQYDIVLLACQGAAYPRTSVAQQNMIDFGNAGGRVYTTHFSYVWIYQNAWNASGDWSAVDQMTPTEVNGIVNTSFPQGQDLADWLMNVGASTLPGVIPVKDARADILDVAPGTRDWIRADPAVSTNHVLHMTFDTPIGNKPEQQCGRVLFDDFHVEEADLDWSQAWPQECKPGPMTAQEKLLEFMIFDLSSCIGPDMPPK